VNLTAVRLLAPHLTAENHQDLLRSVRGLRKSQVEEVVARLAPKPDVPTSIRKLPSPMATTAEPHTSVERALAATSPSAPTSVSAEAPTELLVKVSAAPPESPVVVRPAEVRPLSPDRYKLQLTIGGDTLEKLRLAKDLLRYAVPSGDDAAILDRALAALLVELAKKKFAASDRARPSRATTADSRSRYIPAEVKRAVYVRDLGRCAFVGVEGHRCGERAFVEFHHLHPYAEGGQATVENIELRCRRHNSHEWQRLFAGSVAFRAAGMSSARSVAARSGTSREDLSAPVSEQKEQRRSQKTVESRSVVPPGIG
jgi:hypothetical protein